VSTVDADVSDLHGRTAGSVITVRGKELAAAATVADARRLFESSSVQIVPVLDGDAYVGSVTRDDVEGPGDADPIAAHARRDAAPLVRASTPLVEALDSLGDEGGRRIVVLGDDGSTYVGLICLNRDRRRLCIDAECHAAG
jgi:CBS-domain-containing membrane protein